jgi:hypothetical protein
MSGSTPAARLPRRSIRKYTFDGGTFKVQEFPAPYTILHVGNQREEICIWVMADFSQPPTIRTTFSYEVTGAEFIHMANRFHIGTVLLERGNFVAHVFKSEELLP